MGKKIRIREEQPRSYFIELRKQLFGSKYKFLDAYLGSGVEKIRIRDGKNYDPG
jgi:hypothetical protein